MIGCNSHLRAPNSGYGVSIAKSGRFESDARDRRIHGYRPMSHPHTPAEARRFVHPDDLPNLDAAFAASMRAGSSCKVEYRLATPCAGGLGQERWVAVEGTVVRGPAGQPARWLGITRDITARKQAADKLEKSEREIRGLLEALPAAIYMTDACRATLPIVTPPPWPCGAARPESGQN